MGRGLTCALGDDRFVSSSISPRSFSIGGNPNSFRAVTRADRTLISKLLPGGCLEPRDFVMTEPAPEDAMLQDVQDSTPHDPVTWIRWRVDGSTGQLNQALRT